MTEMEPKAPARSTTADSGTAGTTRAAAKAARREQLLSVAKNLYARHGFHGVRLDDLGKGAGISAPAVYRHFESKEAVLEELLVGISEYLNSGGDAIITRHEDDRATSALIELIDFHVAFAMSEPELIRIQDRDLAALPEASRRTVRRLQRSYVSHWAEVVAQANPDWSLDAATVRVHAVFGMINSTPYQARHSSAEVVGVELRAAARAALGIG
ncbi:transcriptional regulator, TetR family [Brevibacterium aurantiacum]|uniref:Transcriptional regulator, TetR family n=2 Tax=Brevibacterium aurantiacum TaxID=273384 RepID=A0A2H1JMN3_BREAU|nr:TetR family transcriptional regulator [Brevibacterium aurantiacum]SMX75553.1 transcriptional regulator, TetR family [Brevibacterium aurantiacum]SMX88372.1 transcriptional regulator, TetR family [Brevibacterium aurantiacum]